MVRKKVECSECHKKVNDLELHMKKHLNIPFKCEICGAEMLRTNYARHLKAHKNERPFPCTLCTRHFRDKYTLRLHLRTHSGERPYKCTLCERSFKLQFQLKNHLNKHYAGEIKEPVKAEPVPDLDIKCEEEAEFECTDCNEKFTSKRGTSKTKLNFLNTLKIKSTQWKFFESPNQRAIQCRCLRQYFDYFYF